MVQLIISNWGLRSALLLLAMGAFCCTSCTKEVQPDSLDGKPDDLYSVLLSIDNIQTRATEPGTPAESWVKDIELFYVQNGVCIETQKIVGTFTAADFPMKRSIPSSLKQKVEAGEAMDIYNFASQTTGFTIGTPVSEIEAKLANASIASPTGLFYPTLSTDANSRGIAMSSVVKGHLFSNTNRTAYMKLQRIITKLRINLFNALPDLGDYNEVDLGIKIINVPNSAFALASSPTITTMPGLNYPWVGVVREAGETSNLGLTKEDIFEADGTTVKTTWKHHCYLNPNNQTVFTAGNSTIVKIFLPYRMKGEATYTDYVYSLPLNRVIKPNHIYQLVINVYGVGNPPTRSIGGERNLRIEANWEEHPWNE